MVGGQGPHPGRRRKKRLTGRQKFLHDLAFAFGATPSELARRLTEREFGLLWQDTMERRLPQRRTEILLAQIAMHIDLSSGAKERASLNEYLACIDPAVEAVEEPELPDLDEQRAAFGFKPINKKPGDVTDGQ